MFGFLSDLGKYRAIVVSVALFIVLDLGVLGLNFYISTQIATDAINVNVAGRQRMLSQRATKSLYDYSTQLEYNNPEAAAAAFKELTGAVNLFDRSLIAFKAGGETLDPSGNQIFLPAVTTERGISSVDQTLEIWAPIKGDFEILAEIESGSSMETMAGSEILEELTVLMKERNLSLLKLMNNLTNELETVARSKADTLRIIQATAIMFAIANFFLILFHFIRELRTNDEIIEQARGETAEILRTVREGLLLLDPTLEIGTQHSKSAAEIFGKEDLSGISFQELIKDLVADTDTSTTEDYIKLLLNKDVKENLVGSLNPLIDVEVVVKDRIGNDSVKHLSFRFNRTIVDDEIKHILVTVSDVTEIVELRDELAEAAKNNGNGFDLSIIKTLVNTDASSLKQFLGATEGALLEVNEILKEDATHSYEYKEKLNSTFRIMHKIKGDAGAMEFPQVVKAAHDFENQLSELQHKEELSGGDFLPLTLALNDFLKMTNELREISFSLGMKESPIPSPASMQSSSLVNNQQLEQLAKRIANEQSKDVQLKINETITRALTATQQRLIEDSVIQLVRNAVVHGIETKEDRLSQSKPATGVVQINLLEEKDGIRIGVRDDGRGLDLEKIRAVALERGLYDEMTLNAFSRTQLMRLIFEPGFSTTAEADEHSGRGVGMDLVRANINKLKGRVRIANQAKQYCEISFLIPNEV